MKKFFFLGLFASGLFFSASVNAQGGVTQPVPINSTNTVTDPVTTAPADIPATKIEFTEASYNFGTVNEGDAVTHRFIFKNVGPNPAKIENVKPTCGCTTPDWTKEEVPVGGEGFIDMSFNSNGKSGIQNKSMTVTYNGSESKFITLTFTGEVKPKPVVTPPADGTVTPGNNGSSVPANTPGKTETPH